MVVVFEFARIHLVLRFGDEKRAGIHLASLDLANFESMGSGGVRNPRLTGIHTQFHASNNSANVLICHFLYTKRITKFNTKCGPGMTQP